jgi:ectoine hydroxylase-related dioxygenase (phytanoyl-CoA dioxygenase family)
MCNINYKNTLQKNGVVLIEDFFDADEISNFKIIEKKSFENPSLFANNIGQKNNLSEFFLDYNNWRKIPEIETLIKSKKLIKLLKSLTDSKNCWIHHDNFFSKKGKAKETPWHSDRAYYIFKGDLNLSVWIPFNDVPKKFSMKFLKASHKIEKIMIPPKESDFLPFNQDHINKDNFSLIDQDFIGKCEEISFSVDLGDMLIFFNNTVHGAKAHSNDFTRTSISLRYLMDGARLTKKYVYANPPFDKFGVKIEEDKEIPESWFPRL